VEVVELIYVGAGVEPGQKVVVTSMVSVVFLPSGQFVTTGGQKVIV
jgi:hypothetical protein